MKRFALIASLLLLALPAHAQLNIRKAGEKPKEVAVLEAQWNWLYLQGDKWFLTTKTDNQFDDWIWILLGETGESAVESVKQLLDLQEVMGDDEVFEIDDRYEKTVMVSLYKMAGKRVGFRLNADGRAGTAFITTAALKKALQQINKEMTLEAMKQK